MSEDPVDYRFVCLDDRQPSRGTIHLPSDVHASVWIGAGSVVWRFAVILEGTSLDDDVVIGNGCFLGRHVVIGAGTRIHPHAALPDGTVVGRRVFIGSNVSLTDVAYPNLADKTQEVHRPPVIEDDVSIGCNVVLCPSVVVHRGAVVGAGAVVTRDVAAGVTVAGNPARPLLKARRRLVLMNEAGEVADG